jgi:hypothetical protein
MLHEISNVHPEMVAAIHGFVPHDFLCKLKTGLAGIIRYPEPNTQTERDETGKKREPTDKLHVFPRKKKENQCRYYGGEEDQG